MPLIELFRNQLNCCVEDKVNDYGINWEVNFTIATHSRQLRKFPEKLISGQECLLDEESRWKAPASM